jgi:general secretion pathway protein F
MSARFRYRAATPEGQVMEGVVHAPSRQSVMEELRRQHLYPVTVDESTPTGAARGGRRLGRRAAVTLWTRNAATLLGAGIPLDRALAFTAQFASHPGLAETIRQVRRAVQGGASLADALAQHPRYFDPLFIALVSAGESSGALDVVFARLSEHMEESAELRSQVFSALLYPALLAVVAIVGVTILLGFVIPRFATVLADVGGTLPLSTRLLLGASALLTKAWWLWLALGAAAVYLIPTALARPETRRRWHATRLAWPWIGDIELK